jgi:hypothetical protein
MNLIRMCQHTDQKFWGVNMSKNMVGPPCQADIPLEMVGLIINVGRETFNFTSNLLTQIAPRFAHSTAILT